MSPTRRTILAAVATAGIAGCTEELPPGDPSEEETSTDTADPTDEDEPEPEPDSEPEREPQEYDPLFDFHDLSLWEPGGGDLTEDRENYLTGEGAARIDVDSGETWARIERSGLDLDLSERRLNLVGRVHLSDSGGQSVDVLLEDREERQLRLRSRLHKTDEDSDFMPLDLGIREWEPDEGPDLSSISRIRIQSRIDEDDRASLWLDSLDAVDLPETPILMIQWDDGFLSQYTEGLPIQREYDIPANTFINPANVGSADDRLTLEQVEELREAGWEISSHLYYHDNLTELEPDEQERQIREAKEWLVERGFERGAEYFAYPYGEHDQSSYELVGEYHSLAMIGGEPGYGLPRNRPALGRSSERTFEEASAYVDTLIRWGGVGGLFWHEIPGETPIEEFDRIMQYIAERRDAGELDVLTLSELDERLEIIPELRP